MNKNIIENILEIINTEKGFIILLRNFTILVSIIENVLTMPLKKFTQTLIKKKYFISLHY